MLVGGETLSLEPGRADVRNSRSLCCSSLGVRSARRLNAVDQEAVDHENRVAGARVAGRRDHDLQRVDRVGETADVAQILRDRDAAVVVEGSLAYAVDVDERTAHAGPED